MQGLITYVLIISFVSPCLCLRWNVETNNTIYNVMQYGARGDGKSDDSQAFLSAWKRTCEAEGTTTLVIPPGKTFMVTGLILSGACKANSIHIQLQGEIVAPSKEAWRAGPYWITIEYVNRLTISGRGGIDGYGSTWWQCKSCHRPVALFFHSCSDLTVSDLRITNSPGSHVAIDGCKGAKFSYIFIHSPPNSPNTDGFDIDDSNNILIEDSNIKSGDDCIAINDGSSYINVTRVVCGPGHGISVGSLGRNQARETVEEVYVQNCTFIETSNGARIKTVPGGAGYARMITFEQIQLINVKNPIIIDQYYILDSEVQVSEITYRGFNGTSASDIAIDLSCASMGCFNIVLDQINIVSAQPGKKTSAVCQNVHGTAKATIPSVPCLSH